MEKHWRIINTHDKEEEWVKLVDFVPRAGEQIIYDVDSNYSYERVKIGDGVTKLNELPFVFTAAFNSIFNVVNNVLSADGGKISNYKEEATT